MGSTGRDREPRCSPWARHLAALLPAALLLAACGGGDEGASSEVEASLRGYCDRSEELARAEAAVDPGDSQSSEQAAAAAFVESNLEDLEAVAASAPAAIKPQAQALLEFQLAVAAGEPFDFDEAQTADLATTKFLRDRCPGDYVEMIRMPSAGMVPTLRLGDIHELEVNAYDGAKRPQHHDIVAFNPPQAAEREGGNACTKPVERDELCAQPGHERGDTVFIKRVVAEGGHRVRIIFGQVSLTNVQGEPFEMAFTKGCPGPRPPCYYDEGITIPDGHVYLMGDNRDASFDSKEFGPVPEEWIIGRIGHRVATDTPRPE